MCSISSRDETAESTSPGNRCAALVEIARLRPQNFFEDSVMRCHSLDYPVIHTSHSDRLNYKSSHSYPLARLLVACDGDDDAGRREPAADGLRNLNFRPDVSVTVRAVMDA